MFHLFKFIHAMCHLKRHSVGSGEREKKTLERFYERFPEPECERVTGMSNSLAMQIPDLITLIHWCRIC